MQSLSAFSSLRYSFNNVVKVNIFLTSKEGIKANPALYYHRCHPSPEKIFSKILDF
ncbi:MAG: hypothetical protein JXA03_09605 [Bacteroidales bacterium]|nr:hypothetical protein [Bacteroidales bacterium]